MKLPVGLVVLLAASTASAQQLRFSATEPGGILATGNTLGLSKQLNANGPGISDSIGTFLTLESTVDDVPPNTANPWSTGTTADWTQNGSSAVLDLPDKAEVLYAELLWGGSYDYGGESVLAQLQNPVTLAMGAPSTSAVPDTATAQTIDAVASSGFLVKYYLRSANVTEFVRSQGAGTYAVKGVPGTQHTNINSLNAAGWTLVVAYRDFGEPMRNLSVFVGGSFVDEDSQQDYLVSGFCSPPTGMVQGTVRVSAMEGDASLAGDQLLLAPTAAGPFAGLSGANNPANNIFCSQLNDASGALDTRGTSGQSNHNATGGTNVAGGRQGWDVTTVALSSAAGHLQNNQTSAVLRTITTGDSFMPIHASFAIDVNAPDLATSTLTVSPQPVRQGEPFTITAVLTNTGALTAQNVVFSYALPPEFTLVSVTSDGNSGDIAGNAVTVTGLAAGVDEGNLAGGQQRTVVLQLLAVGAPAGEMFAARAEWSYNYASCANADPLTGTFAQLADVVFVPTPVSSSSSSVPESSSAVLPSSSVPESSSSVLESSSAAPPSSSLVAPSSLETSSSVADASSASSADGTSSSRRMANASTGASTVNGAGDGEEEEDPQAGACGCRSTDTQGPAGLLLMAGLVLLRVRRRH